MLSFSWRFFRWCFASARALWLAVGIAIAGFVVIELAILAISIFGLLGQEAQLAEDPARPDTQLAYRRELAGALRLHWNPETCWIFEPIDGEYINVDADGRRKSWNDSRSTDKGQTIHIWCFGGSTLWGFGSRDEMTIPSELAKELAASTNEAIQVTNFAVPGYVFSQESALLNQRLRQSTEPDLVLFFDGYNDLISAFVNARPGVPLWDYHYREGLLTRLWHATGTYRIGRQLLWICLPPLVPVTGPAADQLESLAEAAVEDYLLRVQLVEKVNRSLGIKSLFCWQPTLFDKPYRTKNEERIYATLNVIQIGKDSFYTPKGALAEYFAAAKRILRQRLVSMKLPIVDLTDAFISDSNEVYFDGCHYIEPANKVLADRLANDIKSTLQLRNNTALNHP